MKKMKPGRKENKMRMMSLAFYFFTWFYNNPHDPYDQYFVPWMCAFRDEIFCVIHFWKWPRPHQLQNLYTFSPASCFIIPCAINVCCSQLPSCSTFFPPLEEMCQGSKASVCPPVSIQRKLLVFCGFLSSLSLYILRPASFPLFLKILKKKAYNARR